MKPKKKKKGNTARAIKLNIAFQIKSKVTKTGIIQITLEPIFYK